MLALNVAGQVTPWTGQGISVVLDQSIAADDPDYVGPQIVDYPLNIEQHWTDAELLAVGLHRVTLGSLPDGYVQNGSPTYQLVGDVVVETIPSAPRTYSMQDLHDYAADKRWRVETGGIVLGGLPVATDDRSKLMIAGARISAQSDPEFETDWAVGLTASATIDAAQVLAISDAVLNHVHNCFAVWKIVVAAITGGTITSPAQIESAEWPSNT